MVAQAQQITQEKAQHPLIGLATLMSMVYNGDDLTTITQQLLGAAATDEPQALLDLATLVQLRGDRDTGIALQAQALSIQQHYQFRPTHGTPSLTLLAIMAPGDLMSNTPLEFLAQGAGVNLDMLYLSPTLPVPKQLPAHDIAMVAVSELDRNRDTLQLLEQSLPVWPRPVLNRPTAIGCLSRDQASRTLDGGQGLLAPLTVRIDRTALHAIANGDCPLHAWLENGQFPIIIRPIDSHAGMGLQRIDCPSGLQPYLHDHTGDEFFVSRFIDYRSADGQFRKYRIVLIDGQAHLAHMAVSEHWMIHYLNAGMAEFAHKRREEAQAMAQFNHDFLPRHAAALRTIYELTALDYLGIDCAETRDGKLLVFEVGNSMVVHNLDSPQLFPYKQPQMQKLFAGFKRMLESRIARHHSQQPFKLLR